MRQKILLPVFIFSFIICIYGQNTFELTFTGIDNAAYLQLDSIKVMNRTQGGETTLIYPDTILVLDYLTGISEVGIHSNRFHLFQNYPNPVIDKTNISFYIPEKEKVKMVVTDILGRVLLLEEKDLNRGYHAYIFTPGKNGLYLFTVTWKENKKSIKILQSITNPDSECRLEYLGNNVSLSGFKLTNSIQSFPFSLGDQLLYIGYVDTLQSGMLDIPEVSATYTFQFATNIPCPETPTVTYEGQVYNTIQIFSQCWLKENLNVGVMIPGGQNMTDNDAFEKYCYNNEPDSCDKYGGLYQWDEMMLYSTQQGVQGICPPGWHLPTWEESKVIDGAVDSQYGIGDPEWGGSTWPRGYDVGMNLKTTYGWNGEGNGTDLYGFSALPGGSRNSSSLDFQGIASDGNWWTSSDYNLYPGHHGISYLDEGAYLYPVWNGHGFSVRCLRDY